MSQVNILEEAFMKSVLTGILALAFLAIEAAFGQQVATPPQQTSNSLQAALADPNLATSRKAAKTCVLNTNLKTAYAAFGAF
jgi:hypothetical protein